MALYRPPLQAGEEASFIEKLIGVKLLDAISSTTSTQIHENQFVNEIPYLSIKDNDIGLVDYRSPDGIEYYYVFPFTPPFTIITITADRRNKRVYEYDGTNLKLVGEGLVFLTIRYNNVDYDIPLIVNIISALSRLLTIAGITIIGYKIFDWLAKREIASSVQSTSALIESVSAQNPEIAIEIFKSLSEVGEKNSIIDNLLNNSKIIAFITAASALIVLLFKFNILKTIMDFIRELR